MTKGFPLAIAPVVLAWLWAGGDRRGALRGAAALAATLAALALASVAVAPGGALDALGYQLDRPVQVESAPASVLWGLEALGGERPSTRDSHGSVALEHPLAAGVGIAFSAALALTVAALALLAARGASTASASGRDDVRAARPLVLAALAALAACAALGPVLSPQFLTWTVPLLALALAWRMHALAGVTAAACALTLAEFPARYFDLVAGEPLAVVITAARNAALLAAVAIALGTLARGIGVRRLVARRAHLSPAAPAPARSIAPARPARPR